MARKKKKTSDALDIIERRHFNMPESRAELEEARASAAVARKLHDLRKRAGLTQMQLAELVGTTHTARVYLSHGTTIPTNHLESGVQVIFNTLPKLMCAPAESGRNRTADSNCGNASSKRFRRTNTLPRSL